MKQHASVIDQQICLLGASRDGVVAFVADRVTAGNGQESSALFRGQPVPQAHAQTLGPLDAAYPCRKVRIQQDRWRMPRTRAGEPPRDED